MPPRVLPLLALIVILTQWLFVDGRVVVHLAGSHHKKAEKDKKRVNLLQNIAKVRTPLVDGPPIPFITM